MEEAENLVQDNSVLIAGLSNSEFAEEFSYFLSEIEADPIKNFIEHKLFMNFQPTPAQRVALKTIFNQELDSTKKHQIWMETQTKDGDLDLQLRNRVLLGDDGLLEEDGGLLEGVNVPDLLQPWHEASLQSPCSLSSTSGRVSQATHGPFPRGGSLRERAGARPS